MKLLLLATFLAVPAGPAGDTRVVLDVTGSTVRGRLTCDGVALAGLPVSIEPTRGDPAAAVWGSTDAEGRFSFQLGEPEDRAVYFGRRRAAAESAMLPDFVTGHIDIDLGRTLLCAGELAGHLAGIVVSSAGQPVADATVAAWPCLANSERVWASARVDGHGQFELATDVGCYRVAASAPGFQHSALTTIEVPAGWTRTDLVLPGGTSLRGRVVDTAGHGLPWLDVTASPASGSFQWTRTDKDGAFILDTLQPGDYTLSVKTRDGRFAFAASSAPAGRDLVLHLRPGGRLRLKATDTEGRVVRPGVQIERVDGIPADDILPDSEEVDGDEVLKLPAGHVELLLTRRGAGRPQGDGASISIAVPRPEAEADQPDLQARIVVDVPEGGTIRAEAVLSLW
jgi:hypothetical protein